MSAFHTPFPIGQAGGQKFDVARAIRNFLQQMAEGNIDLGAAVIKELLQNADDAEATELAVILDERTPLNTSGSLFAPILTPSVLVRNDKPFKPQDFINLCDVGKGHKIDNPTAAGRFGIGFNSVYFLTDTPLIFSQREVHLFDLLHYVVEDKDNGWKFSLDDFRQGERVGPIKTAIERVFPKIALDAGLSLADFAHNGGPYKKTLVTLPLRQSDVRSGTPLFQNSYDTPHSRQRLLVSMWEEGIRSLLFLKHVGELTFSVLCDSGLEPWGHATISKPPSTFTTFLREIEEIDKASAVKGCSCGFFKRTLTCGDVGSPEEDRSFLIKHVAPFDNQDIIECRKKLQKNNERAIPWAAIAIPEDIQSFRFASESPSWRVFLPLSEPGPCSCILHAALFVGPSRQRAEFRPDESDEAQRKTRWNQLLVKHALVPLLRDADLGRLIPDFLTNDPKEALALIPELHHGGKDQNLGDYFKRAFHEGPWELRLRDIWGLDFTLLIEDKRSPTVVEMIPEWATGYRDKFVAKSSEARKFVTWKLGEVLRERLTTVRRNLHEDIARSVLTGEPAPRPEHLAKLLDNLTDWTPRAEGLDHLWAFQQLDGSLAQYSKDELYLVPAPDGDAVIHDCLRKLGLDFEYVRWVKADIGLPAVKRPWVDNLKKADADAALELLRRVGSANRHDRFTTHYELAPVVDFLCSQKPAWLPKDMRLAFLVKTASNQEPLRQNGAIFLRSERPGEEERVLWEGLLRGTFAEIDPTFAPHLRRLLERAPGLRESLDDPDCRFELVASTSVPDFLHRSRTQNPGCVTRLAQELKKRSQLRLNAEGRFLAYRGARLLVEEADRSWDSMNDEEKRTVLLLPVHRTAEGGLLELAKVDSDITSLSDQFWLQSDEDLHDAPIKLLDRQILHSEHPTLNRFYRSRLGIRPKDRITLLRQCLIQIGSNGRDNAAILKYVSDYFSPTIAKLKREGSTESLSEIQELEDLLRESKSVPCADNVWRKASECKSGHALTKELCSQGWGVAQANDLARKLTHPTPLASFDPDIERMIGQLHTLETISSKDLPNLAATSESSSLGLKERAKIIHDNLRSAASKPPQRARVIEDVRCPSLGGETELSSLMMLPLELPPFRSSLVKSPLPTAVDLEKLGTDWGLGQKSVVSFR